MPKSTKLTQKDLDFFVEAEKRYESTKGDIVDRIDEILHFAAKTFGSKVQYWYFDGAEEGEIGPLKINFQYGQIDGFIISPYPDMPIILNDGSEWGIEDGIPIRWLTENYKAEITKGKALYEKKEEEKKAKAKARREAKKKEKAKFLRSAKSKLSKEEKTALGIK